MVKAVLKKGTHSVAQWWYVYTFMYLVRTGYLVMRTRYLSHAHKLLNRAHEIIILSECTLHTWNWFKNGW